MEAVNVTASDGRCDTLGCENAPVEAGRCAECIETSPRLVTGGSADTDGSAAGKRENQDANPDFETNKTGRYDGGEGTAADGDREHKNPIDKSDVTDEERAGMLVEYLNKFRDEFGVVPNLMPLDAEGKSPWITGRCRLDSAEANAALVDGYEAARQIHHEGARGFAIYAGRRDHGTGDAAFVDHDDPDTFPAPTGKPTLKVLSGSGRGPHETYRNDADDPVRNARVGNNDGEIRAENWYVVVPGSIHPSGGVYHVIEDRDIAPLADGDLNNYARPSTGTRECDAERREPPGDTDGEGERPADESVAERLEHAFEHSPNGSKYRAVYNGNYAAAGFEDRSSAEYALACWLDIWVGFGDETTVRRLMDNSNAEKWHGDGARASYRDSVLADVGYQDWYADGDDVLTGDPADDARQHAPEVCAPPAYAPEEFDREQRWDELQGERYEAFLDGDGPHVFADPAGVGKSTNAELGAAGRDRSYFGAFDKHSKGRAAITDDATPEGQFHIKGGEQPIHERCMDAATAAVESHEDETPHCPEHGHPADWPRMCPVYQLSKDNDLRQRYDALAGALGALGAHLQLGLFDEGKHSWHGEQCRWAEQFDHLLDEDGQPHPDAERVAGVHEYQLLKSATEGRDVIVDESPRPLATEQRVTVEDLAHARVRLEGLADIHESDPDDDLGATLRALAEYADDALSALADDDAASLANLDAPDIRPMTFNRSVDPDDLPAGVGPEDVERTTWRKYQGLNNEHYTKRERTTAPVEDYAEPLAKAKLAYNEGLVRQYRDEDADIPTAPFCVDALLAAAANAGLEATDVRRAIAVPTTLDDCPWCGSPLDDENGARVCADDDCGWREAENSITQQSGQQARASAWADDDSDDLRDEEKPALIYGEIPDSDDLPANPLVLDATATPEKIAGLYGARTDDVKVTGDDPLDLDGKLHLTQVVGGQYGESDRYHAGGQYHAQTIKDTESIQQRIQTGIEAVCERHERPLFGIRKNLKPMFEFPENAVVGHYGGVRGLNYEWCDAVCCIGAPHPDVEDIRRKAELLALDNSDLRVGGDEYSTRRNAPNPPVYRKLRYEDEHGDGLAVPTKAYSGLVGALFREAREKELEQFVHRIRPHLVDEDEPMKHAYLLTDVPTDLAVDEVAGFEELADPFHDLANLPEGAMDMQAAAVDVLDRRESGQPVDGVRHETLVETDENGDLAMRAEGWRDLCRVYNVETRNGSVPSLTTIYDWLDRLDELGLLRPEEYEQREGRRHSGSIATFNLALQYLTYNVNLKVDVARRFLALVADGAPAEEWIKLLAEAFDDGDGVSGGHPPPDPTA